MPCPRCGGLIHPIAGRCKHCKEDLSALRSGRPAANAPLPALATPAFGAPTAATPYAPQPTNGHAPTNGHIVSSPLPHGLPQMIQQARAEVVAQPILPPRARSGSFPAAKTERSTWKSWPMLVIVLASIAIIVAVVLMVWPSSSEAGKRSLQPPPAPERMETNPLPPPGQGNNNGADPWGGHSQIDPDQTDPVPDRQAGPIQPRHTPDPIPQAPVAPQDPDDPFGGLNIPNMGQLGQLGGMGNSNVMVAMMAHACDKLKACPSGADDDMLVNVCDSFNMFAQRSAPPTCDAAKKCFDAIDKMDCSSSGFASPVTAVTSLQDCTRAMTSC